MTHADTHDTADPTAPRGAAQVELLSFRIGENEYSVDIMSVREIRGWTKATTLPRSPDYVRGVINLLGTVLPVIDLGLRLSLPVEDPTDRNVIIVVDIAGRVAGLRVDSVSDILSFDREALQPPPDMAAEGEEAFVRALTIHEGRMIRVLDLGAIVPAPDSAAA